MDGGPSSGGFTWKSNRAKWSGFWVQTGRALPDGGQSVRNGEDVPRQPMYRRARGGIGYLAQEPSIFRRMTVEENLLAILQMRDVPASERTGMVDGLFT